MVKNKSIQMKHWNGIDFDNIFPVTLDQNVKDVDGNPLNEKIDHIHEELTKIDELENDFDYKKLEPQFYTNMGLYRNAVNQSFKIDPYTNHLIASQADTNTPEGFFLTQMTPSGQYISKMEIEAGGHGTSIGLDRVTNGDLKIWTFHEGVGKLVQFEYTPDENLSLDQAKSLTDFTPASLRGTEFYVTFDPYHDNLVFFLPSTKQVQIRKRMDVRNHVDHALYQFISDSTEWNDDRPWQGGVSYGTDVYIFSGWGAMNSTPVISKYDAITGEKVDKYALSDLNGENGTLHFRDDFREPEGLEFYVNPYNGKKSLLFCVTSGGSLKRYHMVYGLHQSGAEEHFTSLVKMNAQNYAFTRSDGRAFQVLDTWNDLNKIFKPGYYYIKDNVFATFQNKPPYPVGTDGSGSWWLEVKPADQYWSVRQILTRLSYTPKNIQFERTISLDRGNIGNWNLIQSNSLTHSNFAQPADWGNRIANIIIPDTYYITTPMSVTFTDHPEPNVAGWWLEVSTRSSDGRVQQFLTRNDDTHYRVYRRLVNVETKQPVSDWWLINYGGDEEQPSPTPNRPYQINADDYNRNFNNVIEPGSYYCTSTQMGNMSNGVPGGHAGWVEISYPSASGSSGIILQKHIRNGATNYQESVRRVSADGSGGTNWIMTVDLTY